MLAAYRMRWGLQLTHVLQPAERSMSKLDYKRCNVCMVQVHRQPVLVGGRYLKLKRGVAQCPWLLYGTEVAVTEASVEVRKSRIFLFWVCCSTSVCACF